jgi:aminopeptidase N
LYTKGKLISAFARLLWRDYLNKLTSLPMLQRIISMCTFLILLSPWSMAQDIGNPHIHAEEIWDVEKKQFELRNQLQNSDFSPIDVTHYILDLQADPAIQFISGKVTIYFHPTQNDSSFTIDLSSNLVVDSIVDSELVPFSHEKNKIKINKSIATSSFDSITVYYHGEPNSEGGAFVQSYHEGSPIIWTLSQPYGAREWWPCVENLQDKADSVDLFVTVPNGNSVAANGLLVSTSPHDSTTTFHWKHRYPISHYLIAFAASAYSEINFYSQLQQGNLFVQNLVYPEDSALVLDELLATDTLLRLFDSIVGPYPFMAEKYGHAQFNRGGGMEHQTMSFMNNFNFALNAHELAHQWFGNKITCGSWQDIWLNEGFATYFTGIAYENLRSENEWYWWRKNALNSITSVPDGSVFVEDTTNVNRLFDPRLSYRKGAYVLHMLRHHIGDENFFEGIRSYISDPNLTYKTALTEDFFEHMSVQSGIDLTQFVNEWIYGEGYPSFHLRWNQIESNFEMEIFQETSHESVPFFHVKIPILITGKEGDSLWVKIDVNEDNSQFQFPVNFEIASVFIDPELTLITKGSFVFRESSFGEITLFPNPTKDVFTVGGDYSFQGKYSYQIYSSSGQMVREFSNFNPNTNRIISVAELPQGTYQIVFQNENASITKSFVISR